MKGWPDELRSARWRRPGAATGTRASAPTNTGRTRRGRAERSRRMAVGEHELSCPPHQTLATGEAFRSELDGSKAEWPPIATIHSEKKVSDSEWVAAMRSGSTGAGNAARASVRASSTWRRSVCPGQQSPSRLGQRHGARATFEQQGSGPLLQCPDASAESRLRNVRRAAAREKLPLSVRATKSASQFKSKPVQVHVVLGIGR